MKSIKTYPNFFWLTINLAILSLFGMGILVCLEWIFEFIGFFRNSTENKIGMLFLLLFVTSIFLVFYYQVSNQFTFAKINSNEIIIFQLLKLKIEKLKIEKIYGYSKSEMYYGEVSFNFSSKSLILYSEENNQYEIIKLYNYNFDTFEKELKKIQLKYLGKEQYQIKGLYKRKYKYVK